jgi:hypothetical protein
MFPDRSRFLRFGGVSYNDEQMARLLGLKCGDIYTFKGKQYFGGG